MFDLCIYNIRGLNNKQPFVRDFIKSHRLSFIVITETHVQAASAQAISKYIAPNFSWLFNYDQHSNGRIWIGFDASIWNVMLMSSSAQQSSCLVCHIDSGTKFYASFVYGFCTVVERRILWQDLLNFKAQLSTDDPWCALGDFNIIRGPNESSNGKHWTSGMLDFHDFIGLAGLTDLRSCGPCFTWWNSNSISPTYKRLDRCLVDCNWLRSLPDSNSTVLQRGFSDHCPVALSLGLQLVKIAKPFQFFNHLISHKDFQQTILDAWSGFVAGNLGLCSLLS